MTITKDYVIVKDYINTNLSVKTVTYMWSIARNVKRH